MSKMLYTAVQETKMKCFTTLRSTKEKNHRGSIRKDSLHVALGEEIFVHIWPSKGGVFTVCISNFIFLCCIFVSCQFSLLHHLDMVISRHIIVIINNVGRRQTELLLLSVLIEMKLCVKVTVSTAKILR